jgi:hypothetical protein
MKVSNGGFGCRCDSEMPSEEAQPAARRWRRGRRPGTRRIRLLIQANSGGGKSYAVRKLLEISYGACQHIVIDVEGEFHTLREKYDYALAGKGGEGPADIKSAAMLAHRLLELNVSCIVDIFELGTQRKLFVKRFLEALVDAPRSLWHPAIIVVDEAQKFCPESGKSESAEAVESLMTLGRKRGFCGVLATQRISDLSKSAAAECNNKLIGRCTLDVDQARAGKDLGFTKRDDILALREMAPGEFYALGPAFAITGVQRVRIGKVETTHPKAGQRALDPTPPPPRGKVKEVLGQLANIPHDAEEEARTAAELREQVKQLRRDLAAKPSGKVETKVVDKPVLREAEMKRFEAAFERFEKRALSLDVEIQTLRAYQVDILKAAKSAIASPQTGRSIAPRAPVAARPRDSASGAGYERRVTGVTAGETALPTGEAATLRALIQYPDGLRREQLTVLTGYKRSSRDAYIQRLRDRGFVATGGDRVQATDAGVAAMPDAEPLPTGAALQDWWFARLPEGESRVLRILVDVYPEQIRREAIDESTGYQRSSRDAYLQRLRAKQLVDEPARGEVRAAAALFDGGSP